MWKTPSFLIVMLFLVLQPCLAHDVWIEKRDGEWPVFYGHGAKLDPYGPQKIKEVKAIDCGGAAVPVEIMKHKEKASLVPKGKPAVVTLFFDNGYWVKTPDGFKNLTKREARKKYKVLMSVRVRKYTKALLSPCDTFAQPRGLFFEIVPEKDPFSVKTGEEFPIKVLLGGKPFEGAAIAIGASGHSPSKNQLRSGKDGRASVVIGKPGFQLISASKMMPLQDDPDADQRHYYTSITFDSK